MSGSRPGGGTMSGTMSGASIKMENSEESMGGGGGGGKGWRGGGGGGRDRESPSEGGPPGEEKKRGLDPQLWHACAGGMVQLPPVGSRVMYFPQGHGEQAATPPEFPRSMAASAIITCKVTSVSFLADTETDEVYARIRLQPTPTDSHSSPHSPLREPAAVPSDGGHRRSPTPEKPASFAKTLTQSDANNGGGFSVPRYCAETIFPPLDHAIDPPVQTVVAKDVHGERWKFRHIYRGTPRRHLLTTGWSTFVNHKKLVAGDAIVFLRTALGELCVGVRRSMRSNGGSDSSTWSGGGSSTASASASSPHHGRANRWEVKGTESFSVDFLGGDSSVSGATLNGNGLGRSPGLGGARIGGASGAASSSSTSSSFARNRARVTAQSVLDAASLAINGQPFEVVYYPRASTAEFCVKEAAVKAALNRHWFPGMRFKMPFETEDSSRISWFMGTITAVQPADPVWAHSPWRVLQVNWDEPDLLQGVTRVSPWQVEMQPPSAGQMAPYTVQKKKPRVTQGPELALPGGGGQAGSGMIGMGLPMGAIPAHVFGQFSAPWPPRHGSSFIIEDAASAGMQGARHERYYAVAALEDSQFRPPGGGGKIQSPGGFFSAVESSSAPRACPMMIDPHPPRVSAPYPVQCRPDSNLDSIINSLGGGGKYSHREEPAPPSPSPSPRRSAVVPARSTSTTTTTTSNSFLLFGNIINPDSKSQHQQEAPPSKGSSSSDGPPSSLIHHFKEESSSPFKTTRDSPSEPPTPTTPTAEAADRVQKHLRGYPNGKAGDFKWLGWGQDRISGEQKVGESFSHCKVFRESDEVGRTVDLFQFSSYEELFEKIASMFSLEGKVSQNTMVYKDASSSSTKHVGWEPYSFFAKSARRVIILSDRSTGYMRE